MKHTLFKKIQEKIHQSRSIGLTILISFSTVSFLIFLVLGVSVTQLMNQRTKKQYIDSTSSIARQEVLNIENYLVNLSGIANALHYDVIKGTDLSTEDIRHKFDLMYAANASEIISIALFQEDGTLVYCSPQSELKPGLKVNDQEWFVNALDEIENMHFSEPHIQNLFVSQNESFRWVISLSTAVEIMENGNVERGVLLIDMNYQNLEKILKDSNYGSLEQYAYLMSDTGNIIYHPKLPQIRNHRISENTGAILHATDDCYEEEYQSQKRIVITNTISYTGWKLVNVIPSSVLETNILSNRNMIVLMFSLMMIVLLIVNRYIAYRISSPLMRLTDAIHNTEHNRIDPEIYEASSREIQELGMTLDAYMAQIQRLMDDIVVEEEQKRKNELDALQAQINPHFLYNTLDSIVWMIEGEKYEDAVYMITQLASFFRMSLNRGKSIITIENEIRQAKAYLNIQKIRYKNAFIDTFEIEEGLENYLTVKLVIQPILENAIYHGIKESEMDGEIRIRGWRDGNDICICVSDNGYGMTEEEVSDILNAAKRKKVVKHGSGVGLINVDQRLRLQFGQGYGLHVESVMDEGTSVTIRIPAILATEENLTKYEGDKSHEEVEK